MTNPTARGNGLHELQHLRTLNPRFAKVVSSATDTFVQSEQPIFELSFI